MNIKRHPTVHLNQSLDTKANNKKGFAKVLY